MNPNFNRAVIAVIVAICLLSEGCKRQGRRGGREAKGNMVAAKVMDLPAEVICTGTVTPRVGAQVKVGPRVSGKLEHLGVQVGDIVKKGQVLAVLEQRDLLANVTRAEASLNEAEASLRYNQANNNRIRNLLDDGLVSEDSADAAIKALDGSKAQVKTALANLEYAKIQLSYATVTAPIDGIVGSVSTQEGETVASSFSAPTFVTIIDLKRLEVDAYVDEVDIGGVRVGQKAQFTVDAFPDKTFNGVVEAVYPQAIIQDNVVNYDVIIGITDPYEGQLRPQMTASVSIEMDSQKGVLVVPAKAVKHEGGKAFVMVPSDKGMTQRPVTLGRESGEYIHVKAGLSEGDKVLVGGSGRPSESQP